MRTLLNIYKPVCRKLAPLLWSMLIYSCVSPIDLETNYTKTQIVISGQVSNLPGRNFIHLAITSSTVSLPRPVTGAVITLHDENNNEYYYNEVSAGKYQLNDLTAEEGKTYYVRVRMPDGGIYESIPERVPKEPGIVDAQYKLVEREVTDAEGTVNTLYYVNVFTTSTFAEQSSGYLKWSAEEVYLLRPTDFPDAFGTIPPDCFITQNADPQRIALLNRNEINVNALEDLLIASRRADHSFYYKHYFTVYQSGITAEAFEYWRKVNILANQTGSIFDTPPASITGNIFSSDDREEFALGYFQAVNETFARVRILRTELDFFLPPYCDYDPSKSYDSYPSECLECIKVRNSSYERPDWF
jgi:hypothetical protein